MNYRIVSDSSANVLTLSDPHFVSVPMKVRAAKEYVDDTQLDLSVMVEDLRKHNGPSGSSCPSVGEWLEAFGDAENIFVTTISKNLSGSYNSATQAAKDYMDEHPDRKVFVLDSLAAGPQQAFVIEKLLELCAAGHEFDRVKELALEYHNHTHIVFCLESMMNLARNGRVPMAVARIGGLIGIRICGDVKGGLITPVHKPRGNKKATAILVDMMKERGFYNGAQLRIAHCFGEAQARALANAVLAEFPDTRLTIEPTTALCSFYAESGGLMIGFEGGFNTENDNSKF